jgi:hypothetical protein
MTVSTRALTMLANALRHRRTQLRTRWRHLDVGRQALLVVAYLRKGETYADLACGFAIGTSTVYRYLREAFAAISPMLGTRMSVRLVHCFQMRDGQITREIAYELWRDANGPLDNDDIPEGSLVELFDA